MGEKESISGMGWGGMFGAYEVLPEIVGGCALEVRASLDKPRQANGSHASQKPSPRTSPSLSSINTIQHRRLCQMNCSPIRTHWLRGTPLHSYRTPVQHPPPATPQRTTRIVRPHASMAANWLTIPPWVKPCSPVPLRTERPAARYRDSHTNLACLPTYSLNTPPLPICLISRRMFYV